MKKTILIALAFAAVVAAAEEQYYSSQYLTRAGWRAGWNAWNLGKCSLYGAGAGAYGGSLADSTLIGAGAGAFASNSTSVVGIGHRALKKAAGLSNVVAIGEDEMSEAYMLDDVTSINKQIYVSGNKVAGGWAGFWISPYRDDGYTPPDEYAPLYYTASNETMRLMAADIVFTNTTYGWGYVPENIDPPDADADSGNYVIGGGTLRYPYGLFTIYVTFNIEVEGKPAGYEFSIGDSILEGDQIPVRWRHVIYKKTMTGLERVNEWQCYVNLYIAGPTKIVLARFDDATGEYKGYQWDDDNYLAAAPNYNQRGNLAPPPIMPNPQPLSLRSAATKLNALKGKTYDFLSNDETRAALADLIELFGGSVTNYIYNSYE